MAPKRATACSAAIAEAEPDLGALPYGYSVVTEFDGTPRAVIRTTSIARSRLCDVDAQFAWDEGEGDRTLADWLAEHTRFFSRECANMGVPFDPAMPVQLERFELLYPFDRALAVPDGPRVVPGYLPGAIAQSRSCTLPTTDRNTGWAHCSKRKSRASLASLSPALIRRTTACG